MKKEELGGMIDHTLLKPIATPNQIKQICKEAMQIKAASVCVNPCNVALTQKILSGTSVKICTVIGFPLGANTSATKAYETKDAIANGAEEVDMVINMGALKAGDTDTVFTDIKAVVDAANGVLVKVIIETCFLTDEEKVTACLMAKKAGADFVKTSTGFGTGGANAHDVALMKEVVGEDLKVKASGGMRSYADVLPILEAGADRLGLSASLAVLEEAE